MAVKIQKITRCIWGVYDAQEQGLKIDAYNNPVSAVVKYLQTVIDKKLGR